MAAGAVQMGASVVLIERGLMGGDCLNFGCVPSKALIAAAASANDIRGAGRFGVHAAPPRIDASAVRGHVRGVIEAIRPHDSVERFEGLGCTVIQASAAFTGPGEVEAGDWRIRARRFVIATGSSPAVPPIPGLEQVGFLTNETIFDLAETPAHLIVIGGGPIGLELAQAQHRLGAKVTVVEAASILAREDPDLVALLRRQLSDEGLAILEATGVSAVGQADGGIRVTLEGGGALEGSHLLVATGRKPAIGDLGLDRAGIEHSPKGITVDRRLRTSNRKIFAIGDVTGGPAFTHLAGHHAGVVVQNALLRLPAKANTDAIPRVTFTDPELAQVGMTEAEARGRYGPRLRVLWEPFAGNDRARAGAETLGGIKLIASPGGKVLGVGILGRHAGELLLPWSLAITRGIGLKAIAGAIVAYPTLSEISKRVAGQFYTPRLFGPGMRRLVRILARFG